MKKFPKKAKLITNGGFSRIIELKEKVFKINFPYSQKIQLNTPELYGMKILISCNTVFELEKVNKNMAIYRQVDAIILNNKLT